MLDAAPAGCPISNGWRWTALLSNAGSVVLIGLLVVQAGQRQQSKNHYLQLTDMRTEAVIGFIGEGVGGVTIEVRQAFGAWLFPVPELQRNLPVDLNKIRKKFEAPSKLLHDAPAFEQSIL